MAKFAATDCYILLNSQNISDWCFGVDLPDSKNQIDLGSPLRNEPVVRRVGADVRIRRPERPVEQPGRDHRHASAGVWCGLGVGDCLAECGARPVATADSAPRFPT